MHGVELITAEHSPTARPAEVHNVKPAQFWRASVSVLIVYIVGMWNEDENLKIGHALNKLRMMQLKWLLMQKTNIIPGFAKALWPKCGYKDILEDAAQNNQ